MQNDSPSSYFNRLVSSAPQQIQRRQYRKNSQKSQSPFLKQNKQSINQFPSPIEDNASQRNRDTSDFMMTKKKSSSQQPNQQPSIAAKVKQLSAKQQQALQERIEQDERREYLATKITPVLNKLLVKMVNEKPKKVMDYMIDFLKKEEGQFQNKRFNTRAQNDTILQDKNMEEVFDETVAVKFLKFKK